MKTLASKHLFHPRPPDAAGVISWVHLGDLHMTKAGEQNHLDLAEIVNEVNQAFAALVSDLDGRQTVPMKPIADSHVWKADVSAPLGSIYHLKVSAEDASGTVATDEIRIAVGQRGERECVERDQDNALKAWPEHGLLGTQLGPNKNGKKW